VSTALDHITRVRGVRGAMLVSAEDGIVVAEQLMEGIKGGAVAALAASLAGRLRRRWKRRAPHSVFWHLQAEQGALLVVRGERPGRNPGRRRRRAGREYRPGASRAAARRGVGRMSPQTRAVESWTLQPLTDFVREASVRLVLVLTPSGQVLPSPDSRAPST